MKLRPYQEEDLPALVALWNATFRGSYEFIPYTEERLREELEEASPILLAVDKQGGILGLTLLRREWYGEELEICARPGLEREEIKEQLLAAIEPQSPTTKVTIMVDAEDQGRIGSFTARGYGPAGSLYQMIAELDQPRPIPLVPPGYSLRCLRPDEEEALIQVVNTAYRGERLQPGVLARWEEEDPAFSEEWVQVAECENKLVAAVIARSDREFNLHYHARRGYLGPAATLPDHRGRGLNRTLTARAMDLLGEKGMKTASLYTWEGNAAALAVLRSLGFQVGHQWRLLTRSTAPGNQDGEP